MPCRFEITLAESVAELMDVLKSFPENRFLVVLLAIGAASVFFSPLAAAEYKELLVPVAERELELVRTNNDYFLKVQLYFAKRHRLVKVNAELLRSEDRFTVTPFEDVTITLERISVDWDDRLFTRWKGRIVDPISSLTDYEDKYVRTGSSIEEARQAHAVRYGLLFHAMAWDVDLNTGAKTPAFRRPPVSVVVLTDQSPVIPAAFESLLLDLDLEVGHFTVTSLKHDPEYHLVVEIDADKWFQLSDSRSVHPETLRRYQMYRDYMMTLGEDPRRTTPPQ